MKKVDQVIGSVEKYIGVILCLIMCLCVLIQIVFRLSHIQVAWTEELARYIFVCVTYYGSIYAIRMHKHLKVEILESFTGEKGKYVFRLINDFSSIIFYVIMTKIFLDYMAYLTKIHQTSAVLHLDIRIVYLAPLALCIFGLYELIKDVIHVIRTKEV